MKNILYLISILFATLSCNSTTTNNQIPINEIVSANVKITDSTFTAIDSLPAGFVNIKLVNEATNMHSAHLIKLKNGYSTDQLIQAYADSIRSGGDRPEWMIHRGGVISETGTSDITMFLEPGEYTWVCVMGPDSLPHFKGHEHQSLIVSGKVENKINLGDPDLTIKMTDKDHQLSNDVKRGNQSIDIVNSGMKYHLVAISKLNEGASSIDLINWFKTFNGPPPATGIFSSSAIGPGLSARVNIDFQPGNYVLYCMANAEGQFHLFDGAISSFTVE